MTSAWWLEVSHGGVYFRSPLVLPHLWKEPCKADTWRRKLTSFTDEMQNSSIWNGLKSKRHYVLNTLLTTLERTDIFFFFFLQNRGSFQGTITRDLNLESEVLVLILSLTID